MKVKLTNPDTAVGLVDPHTRRRPFVDPAGRPILDAVEVPDTIHWQRRIIDGSIVMADQADAEPTGAEPLAPLTTRARR